MRKFLPIILILQVLVATAQVGVHTDFPDNSSAMDIVAANKGLLIPRVTLTNSLANPSPVTAPAVGLLVFNSGPNQAIGFYYWNGSTWVLLGGGSSGGGDGWALTGNAGTIPGTNFLGTTDNQHFLIYSNNAERMRIESDGQIVIDSIAPRNAIDQFSVIGNATQTTTIAAYPRGTGFYSKWGRYGLVALVDTAAGANIGYGVYARNYDAFGYGLAAIGSNISSFPIITNHTSGIASFGYDGLQAWGRDVNGYGIFSMGSAVASPFNLSGISAGISTVGNYGIIAKGTAATGRGIVAVGSGQATPSTSLESEGGAFTGYHGVFGKGVNAQGIGVIGIGSNAANYSIITGGLGGSFSGNYGVYGKGLAADGVGVLGLGSGGSGYYTVTGGSGGAFTGNHGALSVGVNTTNGTGIIAAGNNGSYNILPNGAGGSFTGGSIGAAGFGLVSASGIGLIGAGNNQAAWIPSNGCGGAFTGNTGIFSRSTNAVGTGIVAAGNNVATINTYASGTGGAFTGATAGIVSWGIDGATGTGVIGSGNNITAPLTYATGSGGAFTGTNAGVVGWGTTVTTGTGVIGVGNNVAILTYSSGSGGAFSGNAAGMVAYGRTAASGVGVIGLGNNITTAVLPGTSGCGGAFTGNTYGVTGYANTAGSSSYGVYGQYNGGGNNDGTGVYGYSAPANSRGTGVRGYGNNYGVLGVQGTSGNSNYGVYATGNMGCSGTKSFAIDHPLDPENKFLKHFSIESPEVLNMYRGNALLNENGIAFITLPDYFISINVNYSYDLTPIGSPAPNLYVYQEINEEGIFGIAGGLPGQKISWVVYAERNDPYMQQEGVRQVEIEKDVYEKGKYLMPELYQQPDNKGIFYLETNNDNNLPEDINISSNEEISFTKSVEVPAIVTPAVQAEMHLLETKKSDKEGYTPDQSNAAQTIEVKQDDVIEQSDILND